MKLIAWILSIVFNCIYIVHNRKLKYISNRYHLSSNEGYLKISYNIFNDKWKVYNYNDDCSYKTLVFQGNIRKPLRTFDEIFKMIEITHANGYINNPIYNSVINVLLKNSKHKSNYNYLATKILDDKIKIVMYRELKIETIVVLRKNLLQFNEYETKSAVNNITLDFNLLFDEYEWFIDVYSSNNHMPYKMCIITEPIDIISKIIDINTIDEDKKQDVYKYVVELLTKDYIK